MHDPKPNHSPELVYIALQNFREKPIFRFLACTYFRERVLCIVLFLLDWIGLVCIALLTVWYHIVFYCSELHCIASYYVVLFCKERFRTIVYSNTCICHCILHGWYCGVCIFM